MSTGHAWFIRSLVATLVAIVGLGYQEQSTMSRVEAAPLATAASIVYETSTKFATPVDPNRCTVTTFVQVNQVARATRYSVMVHYLVSGEIAPFGLVPPYPGDSVSISAGPTVVTFTAPPGTHRATIGGTYSTGQGCVAAVDAVDGYFAVVSATAEVPDRDYVPRAPARLVDTRPGATTVDGRFAGEGPRPLGSTLEVAVTGRGGIDVGAGARGT